ncbi:MAG: hypothetical protein U0359_04075 [Byssovorax sp.]
MAKLSARVPGKAPPRRVVGDDDPVDAFDVPAAILCACCGQADCLGCRAATDTESGVLAIIPWERSADGTWSRLWATANATTRGAESFFAVLPDGEIPAAMRFAVLAELLAVGSMVALLLPLAALALPTVAVTLLRDGALALLVLRWVAVGVPALALWMVLAHVTHGAALDAGARRQGAPPQRRRAVRYGLYACGWDLMSGPIGFLGTLFTKGVRAAFGLVDLSITAPAKAATALLQGIYRLPPDQVIRARRAGTIAAVLIAIASAFAVIVAAALALSR